MIACENPPDAWYMTPHYHNGNKNEGRIFAYSTCSQGYKPNGIFCEKLNYFVPSYCTVAHIYRKYSEQENEFTSNGLYYPSEFKYTHEFLRKPKYKQLQDLENYKEIVNEHYLKCKSSHKNKDTLVKSICKSVLENGSDIKGLCHNLYCTQANEPFCHQLTKSSITNKSINNNSVFTIFKILVFIMIVVISSLHFKKK